MNTADPWDFLKAHTAARIAQGRTGHSLPTAALLAFQLDHARARDAVHSALDSEGLLRDLSEQHPNPQLVSSQATDRQTYLQRPDLGRRLNQASTIRLQELCVPDQNDFPAVTLCIVIADGLSALAVSRYAVAVTSGLIEQAKALNWSVAPLCVVEQGRVAIGDEIAGCLQAELLVVLIGERPGLSSPDSMGAYLTYRPRPGFTDESRNCVSNIRSEGLIPDLAVQKIMYLLGEMKRRQLSGVLLKDDMPMHIGPHTSSPALTGQSPETPD
jgi:ethanolamine ammonia-lyase small subunit